jgi:putative SOS response-associated peptidase YedK
LAEVFAVDHNQLSERPAREHFPRSQGPIVLTRAPGPERPRAQRWLGLSRWGLVPFWAKELAVGDKLFNARAETLAEKPAFRAAFERRRCIVPVSAFYEWSDEKPRRRFVVHPREGRLLALAGLWDVWRSPSGDKVGSYTIVTVPPNRLVGAVHRRMPAVLDAQALERWLDLDTPATELHELLAPCDDALLRIEPG